MPERFRPENPFSTRYTRPGALPFLTGDRGPSERESDHDLPVELASRAAAHRRSSISGPHGTGKTTLLVHLRSHLDRIAGERSRIATLRIGGSSTELWKTLATVPRGGTMIVDGYEQLALLDRGRLIVRAQAGGIRLIVTAHRPPWLFYRLARTGTSRRVAERLARMLLSKYPEQRQMLLKQSFDQRWQAAGGNVRQLWATLYEDFEDQLTSSHR